VRNKFVVHTVAVTIPSSVFEHTPGNLYQQLHNNHA
jgi:hypothetical protein